LSADAASALPELQASPTSAAEVSETQPVLWLVNVVFILISSRIYAIFLMLKSTQRHFLRAAGFAGTFDGSTSDCQILQADTGAVEQCNVVSAGSAFGQPGDNGANGGNGLDAQQTGVHGMLAFPQLRGLCRFVGEYARIGHQLRVEFLLAYRVRAHAG